MIASRSAVLMRGCGCDRRDWRRGRGAHSVGKPGGQDFLRARLRRIADASAIAWPPVACCSSVMICRATRRQILAEKVGAALAASDLVRALWARSRAQRVVRESCDAASADAFLGLREGGIAADGCRSPQSRPPDAGSAVDGALQRQDGVFFRGDRGSVRSPGKACPIDPFGRAVPLDQGSPRNCGSWPWK